MNTESDAEYISARFGAFLEAAPDPLVVANASGRIVAVNRHVSTMFGYGVDELIAQPVEVLVPVRLRDRHMAHRDNYVADPHTRPMGMGLDLYGRRKDGSEFPVEISLSPLPTDNGMLIMSAVRDITERKRLEGDIRRQNQELEAQNRRVQEASRMKSEFLANMSHELRTPLNSIIGFAEMMHDGHLGAVAEHHREFLNDIVTSARHLLHLINDVLDVSKIESGTMEFYPELVDVENLVSEVCSSVHPLAASKRITVETKIDPAVRTVLTDPAKMKQVLFNYLSNALKFTPEGGRVVVRALGYGDERLRLEVEDNGVGIRDEDQSRLFVEFQQLDAGSGKNYQGTGLGLALTKRIVEAQNGRVGVKSSLGSGSVFFAVLPTRAVRFSADASTSSRLS